MFANKPWMLRDMRAPRVRVPLVLTVHDGEIRNTHPHGGWVGSGAGISSLTTQEYLRRWQALLQIEDGTPVNVVPRDALAVMGHRNDESVRHLSEALAILNALLLRFSVPRLTAEERALRSSDFEQLFMLARRIEGFLQIVKDKEMPQ